MHKLKKILRVFFLIILIILATFGMGIIGNILSGNRERYMDKRIITEQLERKQEEEINEVDDEKS